MTDRTSVGHLGEVARRACEVEAERVQPSF